ADSDSDSCLRAVVGDRKRKQASTAVDALAPHGIVEIRFTAEPEPPLHEGLPLLGQPVATLAAAILNHVRPALAAHPAEESMHAAAVSLLGLEGSLHLDRGSVPND